MLKVRYWLQSVMRPEADIGKEIPEVQPRREAALVRAIL